MDKFTIIAKLREHEGELKAAGIEHLFWYESYAQGSSTAEICGLSALRPPPANPKSLPRG